MSKTKLKQKKIVPDLNKSIFDLTKTSFFTILFSFLLFTSITFFIGIMVGRETIPIKFDINKLDKKLEKLKTAASDLIYKKLYNDNIIKQEISIHSPDTQIDSIHKEKKYKNKKNIKTKIQKKNTEVLKKKQKPFIKPVNKTEKPGSFCVQIAAYKNINTANKLVTRLLKKGYPAYISFSVTNLKRVRIGPYKKQKNSNNIVKKLKKEYSGIYTVNL